MSLIPEVEPLDGARDLIAGFKEEGRTVILASSAKPDEVEHYLDLLDARDLVDGWTTAGDVEQTKPEPDLVAAAVEKAGGGKAIMLGDSTWDCESAKRAGLQSVGVLTGGFSREELEEAGATCVFGSIAELRQNMGDTPFSA
jgi:HAD superfamily hydrolase (TIGR01509 family)